MSPPYMESIFPTPAQDYLQANIGSAVPPSGDDSTGAVGPSGSVSTFIPEWPPAGSLGSGHLMGSAGTGHMMMGISPGMMGISPGMGDVNAFGKSLDMVDIASQLMQGGENCQFD